MSCTLRVHETQPARSRVVSWVSEAVEAWGLSVSGGVLGEVNTGQRREINTGYFQTLGQARVIVTCNPSNWEGDFRLWEAMATGALVFVDEMHTPLPDPPIDGEHIVVYDNSDKGGELDERGATESGKPRRRMCLCLHCRAWARSHRTKCLIRPARTPSN